MVTISKSLRFFWKENFLIKLSFCVLQLNFFTLFKLTNPNVQIEFIHFLTFMPWFAKYMKQWNTCCKYHIELREIVVGLYNVKCPSVGMHGDCTWCACEVCQTNVKGTLNVQLRHIHLSPFSEITTLWPLWFVQRANSICSKWYVATLHTLQEIWIYTNFLDSMARIERMNEFFLVHVVSP